MQDSMQMNHLRIDSSFMKIIKILSEHRQIEHITGNAGDSDEPHWAASVQPSVGAICAPQHSAGSALNASLVAN